MTFIVKIFTVDKKKNKINEPKYTSLMLDRVTYIFIISNFTELFRKRLILYYNSILNDTKVSRKNCMSIQKQDSEEASLVINNCKWFIHPVALISDRSVCNRSSCHIMSHVIHKALTRHRVTRSRQLEYKCNTWRLF